jgi:hypothetical protein
MIQRIQSLWLLLSTVCAAAYAYFPIYAAVAIGSLPQKYTVRENLILLSTSIGMISIAFLTIFFFKNRGLQKLLIITNIMLSLCIFILQYFLIEALKRDLGLSQGSWEISAVLPLFIVAFHVFAFNGIRNDEKLLSSADRMR